MSNRNFNDITTAMPASAEMEKGVLSCMMQAPEWAIARVQRVMKADHFHTPQYAVLFRLICELHRDGTDIDPVTLQQVLLDRKMMDAMGGPAVVAEIYTFAPTPAHAEHYATQVKEKATLRNIIRVCMDGVAMAHNDQDDVPGVLSAVENRIMTIREHESGGELSMSGTEAGLRTVDRMEAQMRAQTADGVPWGLPQLDAKTGGICQGLTIIGAETSGGKSILTMQAAIALLRAGKTVEYYSLEMPIDMVVRRMICYLSGLGFSRIRNPIPDFTSGEYSDFMKGLKEYNSFAANLHFCADGGKTASGILSDVRQKQSTRKVDAVVADYIQRLTPEDSRASAEQQISDASRILKRLADALEIPVITPVQLNDDGKVRGSRMLSMDCDLYIKIIHQKDADGNPAEADEHGRRKCVLYIEKNRNAERWIGVPAFMSGAKMRFTESEDGEPQIPQKAKWSSNKSK